MNNINTEMLNSMYELCRDYGFNYAAAEYDYNPDMNDVAKYNGWLYDYIMGRLNGEDSEGAEDYLMRQFMDKYADVYGEDVCVDFLEGDWYDKMEDAFSNGIEDYLGKQTKIEVTNKKLTYLGSEAVKFRDDVEYEPARATYTVMLHYTDGKEKKLTIENFPVLLGKGGDDRVMLKKVVRNLTPNLTYQPREHKAFQIEVQEYVDNHVVVRTEESGWHYYDVA